MNANFYYDAEKLLDMIYLSRNEFLLSYSYLTEEEYDKTLGLINKRNSGLKSYKMSEHIMNLLRQENELVFRCAISHLMDVGMRNLTLDAVEQTCKQIMSEDDTHKLMTNDFQCRIVEMAGQLARLDHIHILVYIKNNVDYDV